MDPKTIEERIAAHAREINALAQQRDAVVAEANERVLAINTAIIQREGAVLELRSLLPVASPPDAPAPRKKGRAGR